MATKRNTGSTPRKSDSNNHTNAKKLAKIRNRKDERFRDNFSLFLQILVTTFGAAMLLYVPMRFMGFCNVQDEDEDEEPEEEQ
ncbi:hypothetical protein KSS87_008212 [Heliosperma pusillum]|nr:hypothetical protein KSS87_008212 [Heliosperma pusillum]